MPGSVDGTAEVREALVVCLARKAVAAALTNAAPGAAGSDERDCQGNISSTTVHRAPCRASSLAAGHSGVSRANPQAESAKCVQILRVQRETAGW